MNNSPSWIVKCHLTADAHVSAVGTEIAVVGCFSGGGGSPKELESPSLGLLCHQMGNPRARGGGLRAAEGRRPGMEAPVFSQSVAVRALATWGDEPEPRG